VRSGKISEAVYAQQVRTTFSHLPLVLCVSGLNSALVGFVLLSVVPGPKILIWMGLVLGLSAFRLASWYAYRRLDNGLSHKSCWAYLPTAGALASGILWGSSVFLFFPLDESHLLFLTLVIAGMCAGAATVHAAHFPSVVAFILPAVIPLAVNFFMHGNRLQIVSGILACVFAISLCLASLQFRRWFRETTAARLISARQKSEISRVNAHLRVEIADRRSTEAKLQHAQKMEAIGLLTAGVAHDFNNILLAIGGSAELIANHRGPYALRAALAQTIIQGVGRAATLTQQLLAIGRKQDLMPRIADMNEVLLGMEELLVTTLGGHGGIELQLADAPAIAFVDTAQLELAILNLVINARDAMPNGGSVTLKTVNLDVDGPDTVIEGLSGSLVMISVSDTGTGMPESVRLRAFDPFFTTKDIGSGSGMGLSQVYGLVKQSGGETRIDSDVGRGTTVSIYLPRVSGDSVLTQAARKPLSDHARLTSVPKQTHEARRILVLDDDNQVLETVSEMLRDAGYTVAAFGSTFRALDEVDGSRPIDLMVVDFAMPDMRGDQFAAKARLRRPTVPILFISGYADPTSLQSEPFVLRKPFSVASLIATTEEAMRFAA
jgi:signal transduction histidine kinase/CheY-like chemotaxis protein